MRKIIFPILITFALFGSSYQMSAQAAANKTVTLDVPGMTCQFCPITIRKALKKVDGVIEAKADYDSKTATVTYNPDKTNVQALTNATANAGYPSTLRQQPQTNGHH
ncbi:MAG: mercury resistance system periplasmic binding protein MerP [Gammaproteobacteria bacterium]|nr:mercury resistance system periplasmic binding protein MerP [Gammaproteobacteria bacterium]